MAVWAARTGGALVGLLVRLGGLMLWMAGVLVGVSALVPLLALRMGMGAFLMGKRGIPIAPSALPQVMEDSGGERVCARCWLVELGTSPSL